MLPSQAGRTVFQNQMKRFIEAGGMMQTAERTWDRRVEKWHSHVTSAEAFGTVLERLIQLSSPKPTDACVDLGAGTGSVDPDPEANTPNR